MTNKDCDMEDEVMNELEIMDELLNVRSFLLYRCEALDSILLEYIVKSDIYDTMDKESLLRLLRNCVGFHKSFYQMKGMASRVIRALSKKEDGGVDVVSTISPEKIKMKANGWKAINDYLRELKNEDDKSENTKNE